MKKRNEWIEEEGDFVTEEDLSLAGYEGKQQRTLKRQRKQKEKRIKKLLTEINETHHELEIHARTSVELALKLGHSFIELKRLLKLKGKKGFESYVEKTFPHISYRSVQRYMQLTRRLGSTVEPALAAVGERRLLSLAHVAGKESVDEFLERNKISTNIDTGEADLRPADPAGESDCREHPSGKEAPGFSPDQHSADHDREQKHRSPRPHPSRRRGKHDG